MPKPSRNAWIIAAAVAVGVLFALLLHKPSTREYGFLQKSRPMAVRDASVVTSHGVVHGFTTYFTFRADRDSLFAKAKAELPGAIASDALVDDLPAKVLTIPRVENGRTHLFFPPVSEITFLPEHLALTEGGQLMAENDPQHEWASVRVSEYRQPQMLDSAVDWVRLHFDI